MFYLSRFTTEARAGNEPTAIKQLSLNRLNSTLQSTLPLKTAIKIPHTGDNMCVLLYKKSINGCKSIFHECDKKIIRHFAKKKF